MQNVFKTLALVSVLSFALIGCRNHTQSTNSALNAVEKAKADIATNATEQVDRAKLTAYGTRRALAEATNREPATLLAYDLSERTSNILGEPSYAEARMMDGIVKDSLSGVLLRQEEAAKQLRALDIKIAKLQSIEDKLNAILDEKEAKRDAVMVGMSADADFGRKIKRWLFWGTVVVVGLPLLSIVLSALGTAMPALMPVARIFTGAISIPFKWFFKAVPVAAEQAGVVAKEAYEKTEETLKGVVKTVQEFKKERDYDEAVEQLSTKLDKTLDKPHKQKITEVKSTL